MIEYRSKKTEGIAEFINVQVEEEHKASLYLYNLANIWLDHISRDGSVILLLYRSFFGVLYNLNDHKLSLATLTNHIRVSTSL